MRGAGERVPVTFVNADGLQLFGILHRPQRPRDDGTAILLLSPGVKMRVAPHRLYLKMTEQFVALGYPVLRFDFHGLGDADGEAPETLLADLYGATQVGRYVGDTVAAMDFMQRTEGCSQFIAAGLCGGALTGLLAAQRDTRIRSLVALSIPVILDGSHVDATRHMTAAQLQVTRAAYVNKLRFWRKDAWQGWLRLLTGRTQYSLALRSLFHPLAARLRHRGSSPATDGASPPADNTNPLFAPAFRTFLHTSRKALLVFGESDRLYAEFEAKFMSRHATALAPYASSYEVHVTKQANHIFSFAEWQQDALERCCQFLKQHHGERHPAPVSVTAR
jgi:hypothetical protein